MNMTDILSQMGGLSAIGRELGVSESQAASGAEALLPAILGGFKKQAQAQPSGLDGLGGLLGQLGGGGLLDSVLSPKPTDVSAGNDVLGQIFGSKDVSRDVAQNAASSSGLDPALLRRMLPLLAMAVAGFMANKSSGAPAPDGGSAEGGLGGLLGGLVGGLGGGLGGGRAAPGSARCSTSTATATRSTTSCAWPASWAGRRGRAAPVSGAAACPPSAPRALRA